jgi:transcriptional activator of cad operon
MDPFRDSSFRVGAWMVEPATGEIRRQGEVVRLDARAMRLLQCLARHPGAVLSMDELLDQVWSGVIVTPDSVYQAVASLRRSLGDDPKRPRYIATVPRLGYRMVAEVSECPLDDSRATQAAALAESAHEHGGAQATSSSPRRRRPALFAAAGLAALIVMAAIYFTLDSFSTRAFAPTAERCVAVLPFRDMTDAMDEEPFADGMTEQLIDALSKIPGSHVPSLTSSLYFKGKQTTIEEVARKLGVAYVLEGSVRKSGNMLRVTAQLIRADDGYIVWSNTYDRPTQDVLMVQSDIATEVKHALEASFKHPYTAGNG